jgi:hypothetical protein
MMIYNNDKYLVVSAKIFKISSIFIFFDIYFSIHSIERSLNLSQVFIFFVALKFLSQVAELIDIVNAIVNSF